MNIGEIFSQRVKIEVGDMLPSSAYADRLKRVPPIWDKAFEVNAAQEVAAARRASNSCWPACIVATKSAAVSSMER